MKRLSVFTLLLCALVCYGINHISSQQTNLFAQNDMASEILQAHNKYRQDLNLPPLEWSPTLATHAKQWADHLASLGGHTLRHSSSGSRPGEGENLWMGTSGYYSYTKMVGFWGSEKRYFRYGRFPNVSTTGNWASVGHYTQLIWRNTTKVGCGIAKAGGNDILCCRYSPPGNYMGRNPY